MRSLSSSIALSILGKGCQRGRPAHRRRELAVGLGAGLGGAAGGELVENLLEARSRQLLVIIVIDLRPRRVDPARKPPHLNPAELSLFSHLHRPPHPAPP